MTGHHRHLTCTEEKLQALKGRHDSDKAFMGFTHSLSAIAISLTMIAMAPNFFYFFLGTDNIWVLFMVTLLSAGFALGPDFDNTNSKAKSAFGVVGGVLSTFFRGTSLIVQTLIRKPADDADPDPHRGFWHTFASAFLIGGSIFLLTSIGGSVDVPYLGEMSGGMLIGIFIAFCAMHLTLAGLLKPSIDKMKKNAGAVGSLLAFVLAAVLTLIIIANFPEDTSMQWLAAVAAWGWIIHIVGDSFTTAGVPMLFPIVGLWKKKLWWKTRIPPHIKAGGPAENFFTGAFAVLSVIMLIVIMYD